MIERVFRCSFCYTTFKVLSEAEKHHPLCKCAPERKHCCTCKFKVYEGYPFGGPNCCHNKQSEFYDKSVDDMPDEFDCEVYQKED